MSEEEGDERILRNQVSCMRSGDAEAAHRGDADAQCRLASMCESGLGHKKPIHF